MYFYKICVCIYVALSYHIAFAMTGSEESAAVTQTVERPSPERMDVLNQQLFQSIQAGSSVGVDAALTGGAEVNRADHRYSGKTPLIEAITRKHYHIARTLISAGANPDFPGANGVSPLAWAIKAGGSSASVQILLDLGANRNRACSTDGRTHLIEAIALGRYDIASQLIRGGADPGMSDGHGMAPLTWASKMGHPGLVAELLSLRVDRNHISYFTGRTPLAEAIHFGRTDIAQQLIDAGTDPNMPDGRKVTPLMWAIRIGSGDLVTELLRVRADVNYASPLGRTALMEAAAVGGFDILQQLLSAGARADAVTASGRTALLEAAKHNKIRLINALLGAGALVHQPDRHGDTALIVAAREGHIHVVRRLLEVGAHVNHQTNDGFTAIRLAEMNRHAAVVRLLEDARILHSEPISSDTDTDINTDR